MMRLPIYSAYAARVRRGLRRWRERNLQRALRRGRITPEMADNRRAMSIAGERWFPVHLLGLIVMLGMIIGWGSRLVPYSGGVALWVYMGCALPSLYVFPLCLRHARIERRLRRDAVRDGRLSARFPDRLWHWRQSRKHAV